MKKTLLLIDCQNDFITGSLPVADAKGKMDALTEYVKDHAGEYDNFIISYDSHPTTHCSFKDNGGIWPTHCVMMTEGAELYPALQEAIDSAGIPTVALYKGTDPQKEEYGLVDDDYNRSAMAMMLEKIDTLDVVGIMGEYCVHDSVKGICDMAADDTNAKKIHLLLPFISTADDNAKLKGLAKERNLTVVEKL